METRTRTPLWIAALTFSVFALGAPLGLPALKTVVGADRILRGDLPYRDFWTMYAPGSFYAVAGAFRLFGRELLVQSLCAAATMGATAWLWCDLIRIQGASMRATLGMGGFFLLMLWSPGIEWSSYPVALPFLLFAVRSVHRHIAGEGAHLFLGGIALGLAAACKHDVAGYAAFALAGALFAASHSIRPVLTLAAGALTSALPIVLCFAFLAGGDAWNDLFLFPATDFPKIFADPYPRWTPPFVPFFAWLENPLSLRAGQGALFAFNGWVGCVLPHAFFWPALLLLVVRGREWSAARRAHVIAWLLWIPFFWFAAHVQQNTHVWSMAFGCAGLWSLAWQRARGRGARVTLAILLALFAGGHAVRPVMSLALLAKDAAALELVGIDGARGVLVNASDAALYREIVGAVRAEVRRDEPIHVGVARHDAVVISNQRFYFLCDRAPATRYNELHPGVTDRETVQREMVADIDAHGVKRMVIWHFGWPAERLDSIRDKRRAVIEDAGSVYLDEYLRQNYATELRSGQYSLLRKRD